MPRLGRLLTGRGKTLLMFLDLLLLALSFGAVVWLRFGTVDAVAWMDPLVAVVGFFCLLFLYVFGTYDVDDLGAKRFIWTRVALALLAAFTVGLAVNFFLQADRSGLFGRGVFVGALLMDYVLAVAVRQILASRLRRRRRTQNWLLLASADKGARVAEELRRNHLQGLLQVFPLGHPVEDSRRDFLEALQVPRTGIILGAEDAAWKHLENELVEVRLQGMNVAPLSSMYETLWRKIPVEYLDHRWFLQQDGFAIVNSSLRQRFKRLFDLGGSVLFIALMWPVMLLTALAVRLESKGPALYKQVRTGKGGEDFVIYKFRSMRVDAEKDGAQWAKTNDDRVTKVGRFIRRTRLDEFPQIWNILKGEMSFIGPRPERPEFNESLAKEIPYYQLRHLVRPGVTGWAQVMYPYGASRTDAQRKLEYDLYYIKNYSLLFDLKILLKTVRVVLFAAGR
ncbi:MAG: sugar transferase [Bdellovibrionaceae bacterium]|nr:sugar transferase [Pseudobdellovibrionaceae bacterium]